MNLYQEKVAQLQEAESRLEAEKAKTQQAAQELLEQAEKEGAALVTQAEAAVRQADRDAAVQTERQAAALRSRCWRRRNSNAPKCAARLWQRWTMPWPISRKRW